MPGHSELVDACSAYSKPKPDFKGSKSGGFGNTTQQATAMESLKKPLEIIHEKGSPDLDVNKLYQASRFQDASDKKHVTVSSTVNIIES